MMYIDVDLPNEQSTEQLAKKLAKLAKPNQVFTFSGDLGAGKTTFIRAFLRTLGIQGTIKSPTFALVETYETDKDLTIHHFDLYRIQKALEQELPGYEEYFSDNAICCIEWPEKAKDALKHQDLAFILQWKEPGRTMRILALSTVGENLLSSLKGETCT